MAINSITQFLDNLYTTTWQNRQAGIADNIFNATRRFGIQSTRSFRLSARERNKVVALGGRRFKHVSDIASQCEFRAPHLIQWFKSPVAKTLRFQPMRRCLARILQHNYC